MHIRLAAGTNVGLIRKNNEDNFVINRDLTQNDWTIPNKSTNIQLGDYGCILVVADGMGGLNAGEVASAIAIDTIQSTFTIERLKELFEVDSEEQDKYVREFLINSIKAADFNIYKTSKNNDSTLGMGTTIVITWLIGNKAHIAWCGDSRCYVFNTNAYYSRLSKDHSYVQELVDEGKLEPELAFDHPCSNIITRCLGDPINRAKPDYRLYEVTDGDVLLLCSDGLSGLCQDDEIMEIIESYQDDLVKCKEQLINAALDAGGHDNVTVAMCQIFDDSSSSEETCSNSNLNSTVFNRPKKNLFRTLFSKK